MTAVSKVSLAGFGDDSVGGRARELSRVMPEQWENGGSTHQARRGLGGRIINSLLLSLGLWYTYTEISPRLKLREETGLAVLSLAAVSK